MSIDKYAPILRQKQIIIEVTLEWFPDSRNRKKLLEKAQNLLQEVFFEFGLLQQKIEANNDAGELKEEINNFKNVIYKKSQYIELKDLLPGDFEQILDAKYELLQTAYNAMLVEKTKAMVSTEIMPKE